MLELTQQKILAELDNRVETLFESQRKTAYQTTDRLFFWLFIAQWIVGVFAACWTSPASWAGVQSDVHIHIWTSIFLGGLIIAWPIHLIATKPGEVITRHSVAIAQMLYSALLIHLTGGRIETHFHIFGSLAFLSFYRDWRVLITASLVVVADHVLRGLYFPLSIYGVTTVEPWRWLEHAWWVIFEDVFLISCCRANVNEMRSIARRQAEVEITRDNVEALVQTRTNELEQSQRQLAGQLLENLQLVNVVQWAGDAIIGHSLDGTITSWNNGAKDLFGYNADEIKGKNISILMPQTAISQVTNSDTTYVHMQALQAPNDAVQTTEALEVKRIKRDGSEIEVSLTRSPIFDGEKNVVGICDVLHNISERKQAERRVSEFYSMVSHELRTPLTSVRGALSLLENGIVEPGTEEGAELITVARDSTDRLIRLINDILDLKKIESGKMDLFLKALQVDLLVGECIKSLAGMTALAGVRLDARLHFGGKVMADRDKAMQILTNLISNAVKFSPPDSTVTVKVEAKAGDMVRFNVIDHGPGISQEDQLKLFEKFQQLDASDSRPKGGTGLGLAISKALAEGHGGAIGLESEPGKGSTFWFELPLDAAEDQDATASSGDKIVESDTECKADPTISENKSILLVEDDKNLAQVLTVHFNKSNYKTTWVATIKEARHKTKGETYCAVVLDLTLPDGNGLDLLKELKSQSHTAQIPVIIITGQSRDQHILEGKPDADWLPKPFDTQKLVELVEKVTATNAVRAVMVADCDQCSGVRKSTRVSFLNELENPNDTGALDRPLVSIDGQLIFPDLIDAVVELTCGIWA